jgi:ABC-type glycerol-3-phosphate transport system substrate-binding protein
MNFSQKQIMVVGGVLFLAVIIAVLIFFNLQPSKTAAIQLTVWGFDKGADVAGIMGSYSQLRPNAKVTYVEVSRDNYESNLLRALASGQGPDVFPVHNRALSKKIGFLLPAAASQFSASQMENLFPTEVGQDFVLGGSGSTAGQVYALPLYLDTLSLVYNKDIFDQGGVVNSPATWEELQSDVLKLKNISSNGQISKAGAAIGGSQKTVANAIDILNVLMLQNGWGKSSETGGSFSSDAAGLAAFKFYLQFADVSSDYYTWNESQKTDLDSFSSGNVAMVFAYNSDIQKIKNKSPFLRFGVAPLPQVDTTNAVNYADYWALGVYKQSSNPSWAWDFVTFMATQPQIAEQYSAATGQSPALRELISKKIGDPMMGVFAKQALTARSWNEPDEIEVNSIFDKALTGVLIDRADTARTFRQVQDQINQLAKQQQ